MARTIPERINKGAQEKLCTYMRNIRYSEDLRTRMVEIDRAYARESDRTRDTILAKKARRKGDVTKFQNIEMPITAPAVESGVTYQASVFLTGSPLFGVSAAPAYIDQAIQLETIIDQQARIGRWSREFTLGFRDLFKYNLCLMEVSWKDIVTPALETDLSFSVSQGKPKEVIFSGNTLKRIDPYNAFWDMSVAPAELHIKGDYAGYVERMTFVQLKRFLNSLEAPRTENFGDAFASAPWNTYYEPDIRSDLTVDTAGDTNWNRWLGGSVQKNAKYFEVRTCYCRIIPEEYDMKVPEAATPQIWKFVFVNDSVMVYSERQTNAHDYLPIICAQAIEDGLNYQTKSIAETVMPLQDVSTAMMSSVLYARRRAVGDRMLYDPSRISEAHINNPNPVAKIPVRPAAYGENVANAVYQIPFRDDQSPLLMQEISQLAQLANVVTGQNPARQGQFVKGNKTLHEFDTVMNNANGRDQVTALLIESVLMVPIKEIIKINILQYQGAGQLYNTARDQMVTVDPVQLRNAVMEFKMSDGLTPKDKLANTEVLMTAMQVIGSSAQIAPAYNIGPLFSYIMKLSGATELSSFEKSQEQHVYEQAVQAWQQTIMQILKANPQAQANQFPPQPKPEDYGYMTQQGAEQG